MANYRSIHVKMWNDPVIESLQAHARYLFIYLITNTHRNEAALYSISLAKIAFETGLTPQQVEKSMAELNASGKVLYDPAGSTVWVVNAVRYQALNPNCIKSIAIDIEHCSSRDLAQRFCDHYKGSPELAEVCNGFLNRYPTVTQPLGKGLQTLQTETETGIETGGSAEGVPTPSAKTIAQQAEEIYCLYPKKVAKPDALKSITKALKEISFVELLERTRNYTRIRDGDLEFVPNPATWYNQKRYNDDPETWKPKSTNGSTRTASPQNSGTRLDLTDVSR